MSQENKHHSEIPAQVQQQILLPEAQAIQLHQSSNHQPKPARDLKTNKKPQNLLAKYKVISKMYLSIVITLVSFFLAAPPTLWDFSSCTKNQTQALSSEHGVLTTGPPGHS